VSSEILVPHPAPACPLCGGPNGCAAVAAGTFDVTCWCAQETFPPALLQRLQAEAQGRACICRRCVQAQAGSTLARGSGPATPPSSTSIP
jgi:hypothetical protein